MPSPLQAELRIWSNTEGSKLDAEFVKMESGKVTLRLLNGKIVAFPETKLSDADREFIKNIKPEPTKDSAPAATANRKAKWLTKLSKAEEESKATGLPILMLFTGSAWCPYCIQLDKAVFSEKAFKSFADQNLVLLMLDYGPGGSTNDRDLKKLQADYGVEGFPTYFLTDAAGTKLATGGFHDGINPEVFAKWVKASAPKGK